MKIVALSGSLRRHSYNTRLLEAAACYLPAGASFQLLDIDLPHYNQDLEGDALPASVRAFKQAIADADAVLIATPEFNHSFSGVLKNALDWASRPAFESPFKGKKAAVLTAATGAVGGARAQGQLLPVLASMLCEVYPAPEYLLGNAAAAFDGEAGPLTDATALRRLERFVSGFITWAGLAGR